MSELIQFMILGIIIIVCSILMKTPLEILGLGAIIVIISIIGIICNSIKHKK